MKPQISVAEAVTSAGSCSIRPDLFRRVGLHCQLGAAARCASPPTVLFSSGLLACDRCASAVAAEETIVSFDFATAVSRKTIDNLRKLRLRATLLRAGKLHCGNRPGCRRIAAVLFQHGRALCLACAQACAGPADGLRLLSVPAPRTPPDLPEQDQRITPAFCGTCGAPLGRVCRRDGACSQCGEPFHVLHHKRRPLSQHDIVPCRCLGYTLHPHCSESGSPSAQHPRPNCPACHGTGQCRLEDVALVPFLEPVAV